MIKNELENSVKDKIYRAMEKKFLYVLLRDDLLREENPL
jgi:hypothetical protein